MTKAYHIDDYPAEWLFDEEHDADWETWGNEYEAMYQSVMDEAESHGCVCVRTGEPFWHYVHKRTDGDGLRVTTWDDKGPIGHKDLADALELSRRVNAFEFTLEVA